MITAAVIVIVLLVIGIIKEIIDAFKNAHQYPDEYIDNDIKYMNNGRKDSK